jgi:hypothetical protein
MKVALSTKSFQSSLRREHPDLCPPKLVLTTGRSVRTRTTEAGCAAWFEKARSVNPAISFYRAYLASSCAIKGDTKQAAFELTEARRLSGDGRFSSIARVRLQEHFVTATITSAH